MNLKSLPLILISSLVFSLTQASPIVSSSSSPSLTSARLITDNEEAYRSKIELIRSAKRSLRLMYYIYSDDESSSYMTQLLIEKAKKENVKVDLLVDFHTNFVRWDMFQMMEKEGRGNLRVRFYNRPSPTVIRDVTFMAATCKPPLAGEACRADRTAQANQAYKEALAAIKENRPARLPVLTSTLLAGLYTKNGTAIRTALALGTGKDIQEVKAILSANNSTKMSDDEFEQLKTLLLLIKDAKLKGSTSAKLQLALALALHGDQVAPILKMFDTVVPDTMSDEFANEDDWYHLTDFLHHKFLLADDERLQIGGRNVENSYHVNSKVKPTDKYVFRDTDFVMKFTSTKPEVARTFDRLFNSRVLVTDTSGIKTEMNYELVANASSLGEMLVGCMTSTPKSVSTCLAQESASLLNKGGARESKLKAKIEDSAQNSVVSRIINGRATSVVGLELSQAELKQVALQYLENLPYDKTGAEVPDKRLYFQNGAESASRKAKDIHLTVEKNIRKVCELATQDYKAARDKSAFLADGSKTRRIVIHQGYVILPGEILRALGQTVALSAVNGGSDTTKCPGVRIEILTNSIPTTDLSIINLFAGLQLGALVEQSRASLSYFNSVSDPYVKARMFPPASIQYFELQGPSEAAVQRGVPSQSLHTKVFVFDRDSMIVGSANADVRSYYMDTNNGVELRGAPQFNSDYLSFVDTQKRSANGEAYYANKTANLAAITDALAGLKRNDDSSTKEERMKYLTNFYQQELTIFAQHFEKKWQDSLGSSPSADDLKKLQERTAKMYKYLPTAARIVAEINLQMYGNSQKIISDSDTEAVNELIRSLNLQFELL